MTVAVLAADDGSSLFWSSGTWLLFAAQIVALLLIFVLYRYQGRKQAHADARDGDEHRERP